MSDHQVERIPRGVIKGAYNDPNAEGNSDKYHTGKECIEEGCHEPAGTAWSPYWCVKHNIERMDRVSGQMEDLMRQFGMR